MHPASRHTSFRIVQSRQNSRVKQLRAAFAHNGKPAGGPIAIEGDHLLDEALRSNLTVVTVFVRSGSESLLLRHNLAPATEILEIPPDIFASAVATESPQGIAALVIPPNFTLAQILAVPNPLIVVAAGLQDPGNLGTLVRSAEAFGSSGVVTLPGTVSLWNPKALRSSAGSAFRLPVVAAPPAELFPRLRDRQIQILAAVAENGTPAPQTSLAVPTAILIGNEGAGLPPELFAQSTAAITVPCPGPVESLNAAIAASILLYEAARQRLAQSAASVQTARHL